MERVMNLNISADFPITGRDEDRLNRTVFAEAMAAVICGWRNKPSLVVGLFGDWGSGKSSIKNMVIEKLQSRTEDQLPVVEFSPWQVSGQDLLAQTFFREIGIAIGKSPAPSDEAGQKRTARWKLYSSTVSIAALVARSWNAALTPGPHGLIAGALSSGLDSVAQVVKAGAEGIEAEGSASVQSLSELKAQVDEDLRALERPILVVLDDVDRLTKEEIRQVFQLVKANADFPNIIYLILAQRETVIAALEEIAPNNGGAFLEKIIQLGFDVPSLNRTQLTKLLCEGLDELLAGPASTRFDGMYWASISPEIFSRFKNLRDVKRFLGSLQFHVELFRRGSTFEVNPVDLIAIEALRVFEPEVYKRLAQEKEILTLEPRMFRDKKVEEDKRRASKLVEFASEEGRQTVRNLFGKLFPISGPLLSVQGHISYAGDSENKWFQQLRVCSYQAFDRYFQLATPEGDIAQSEIDELTSAMSNQETLDEIFETLVKRELFDVMLTRIHSLKEALSLEHASTFLAALYEAEPANRYYGFLEPSPGRQITSITYWYLQRLDEDKRVATLQGALRATRSLRFSIDVIGYLIRDREGHETTEPFLKDVDRRNTLKNSCLDKIRETVTERSLKPNELRGVLGYWYQWDPDPAKKWASAYIQSREGLVAFLSSIVGVSEGTGGTRRFIDIRSLEWLISPDDMLTAIEKHLNTNRSTEDEELVKMVKAGIRRRENGRENNPIAFFDDDSE